MARSGSRSRTGWWWWPAPAPTTTGLEVRVVRARRRCPSWRTGIGSVWDVLGPHPDPAVGVCDSGGVIAPAGDSVAAFSLVAGEPVLWQLSAAGDEDRAGMSMPQRRVGGAGEVAWAAQAERHDSPTPRRHSDGRVVDVRAAGGKVPLSRHRGREAARHRRAHDEEGDPRARRTNALRDRGVHPRPQLAVGEDDLVHAIVVRGDELERIAQRCAERTRPRLLGRVRRLRVELGWNHPESEMDGGARGVQRPGVRQRPCQDPVGALAQRRADTPVGDRSEVGRSVVCRRPLGGRGGGRLNRDRQSTVGQRWLVVVAASMCTTLPFARLSQPLTSEKA